MLNPRYIILTSLHRTKLLGRYKVMQLAEGHDNATHPIYHEVRHGRAVGAFDHDEAVRVIDALYARDGLSADIRRGQAAQAGLRAQPEGEKK